MKRSTLDLVITLPWLAAAVVLLVVARLDENAREMRLALMGSAMICFSIGCLARTSVGLHELAERRTAATGAATDVAPAAGPVLPRVVSPRTVPPTTVSPSTVPPTTAAAAAGLHGPAGIPPAAGKPPAPGPADASSGASPPPEPR